MLESFRVSLRLRDIMLESSDVSLSLWDTRDTMLEPLGVSLHLRATLFVDYVETLRGILMPTGDSLRNIKNQN